MFINLKDKEGRVIQVDQSSCYAPDKDGRILAATGGFSYFWGVPTEEAPTHKPNNHPNLWLRGDLIPIDEVESY